MTSSAKLPSARSVFSSSERRRRSARSRFRKVMFETLEERRVLAAFPAPISSWEQAEFVRYEALVKFNPDTTDYQRQMVLGFAFAQTVQEWDELDMVHVRFPEPLGPDRTIQLTEMIHNSPYVEYAEPNLLRHVERVPNDPLFSDMWGMHNVGQVSPYPPFFPGVPDADIDAVEAWDTSIGSPNTVIAVIDTGTDYTHPDLAANIWTNNREVADGVDNDGNGFIDDIIGFDTFDLDNDPQDEHGHGTHVAGTVGAVGDNNVGVMGVSWNSQILIIKAANAGGGFPVSAIVGAQIYITRMRQQFNVNIVASNNSYGALGVGAFSFAEFDAIRTATNAGIAFIAAAGNDATNTDGPTVPHFPSGYNLPGIISVAATDRDDTLALFSNRGFVSVDLGAPGVDILSTFSTLLPPLSSPPPAPNIPPPGYGWLDGTSMASPMVAGAYAVIKSVAPRLTIAEVKSLMVRTVDPLPTLRNVSVSGGRLNLARALDEIPKNEFSGRVFADLDADGQFDAGEFGQSGWTVYVDLNNNRVLDPNEPSTTSAVDGTYELGAQLVPGTYFIREVVQTGWVQSFPGSQNNFAHTVVVSSRTETFENLNFGNKPVPGSVRGIKYNDLNGDGDRDPGEPGIEGIVIYVDVNNDFKIGIGEPAAITGPNGEFQINNILPGLVTLREVSKPGFLQTEPDPTGPELGGVSVLVIGGTVTTGVVFGNRAAFDWGDAPASYGTLAANNGPRHGLLPGFFLGNANDTSVTHIDDELNGVPSADADGDDLNQVDNDEDGVSFLTDLVPGSDATILVHVSSGNYGKGVLQGWIDFNNDGDFLDAGEQILRDRSLATGSYMFTFTVPATATVADTFARFRWGFERGIGPTGPASAGEVEDYPTSARALAPTANDDGPFDVARDSNFFDNEFDVLANDFPGISGLPFTIFSVDATSVQGGLVRINTTNNTIEYKPPAGYIGEDSFRYQISDGQRVSNFGTVRINVVPLDPVAVDDSFNIGQGSVGVSLDVVANDIAGVNGPLTIVARSNPTAGGTVTINTTTNRLVYTPPSPTFVGADTFSYFVTDGTFTSQANVLVQVGGPSASQIVEIEYKVFDDQGQELGVGGAQAPQVGDTIILGAFTRDLRGPFADPILPNLIPDASGVLSAYADVLYDADVVRPVSANNVFGIDITFGANYPLFQSATASVPGIVDEAGASTDAANEYVLGSDSNPLFFIKFLVTDEGTLKFLGNPDEDTANFTFETQVHSQTTGQPIVLDDDEIFFKHSPTIQVGATGEGEATNSFNRFDVNRDTIVSPHDAMLVISHLNRFGAGPYNPSFAAAFGQGLPENFLDVSGDGNVSPFDVKQVVDYLNDQANVSTSSTTSSATSQPQAEGEDDGSADVSQALGTTSDSSSVSTASSSDSSDKVSDYASSVDRLLSDDRFVTRGTSAAIASISDDSDEEEEDEESYFAELDSI